MNIFFDETSTKLGRDYLRGICEKLKLVNKVITLKVPNSDSFNSKDVEVLNIDLEDTITSNYPELEQIEPFDKGVFNSLNYDSLFTLKMMERFGSFKGEDNFEKRTKMFFNHVKFWNYMIESHKIEIAIFLSVPHEPAPFIIYQLMKSKGRLTLYHEQLAFQDTYTLEDKIKLSKPTSFKKDDLIFKNIKFTIEEFSQKDFVPFYSKNYFINQKKIDLKVKKIKRILVEITHKNHLLKYFFYRIRKFFLKKRILNFLKKYQVSPDFDKKYILIPLHYQPEASTSPKGDIFVYQSLMIQMISNSLKDTDWLIYVKEHPAQSPTFGRNLSFYKEINNLNNVFLLNKNLDTKKVLIESNAVGIVTGTMGLEAIIHQIPVLCFGDIYYKFFHGVFPIDSNQQLSEAIEKIKNGFKPNKEKLINELEKIPSTYYHGYVNYEYEKVTKISYIQNIKYLVNNLNNYLLNQNVF